MLRFIEEDEKKKDGFDPTDNFGGKMAKQFPDDKDGDGKVNESKLKEGTVGIILGSGVKPSIESILQKSLSSFSYPGYTAVYAYAFVPKSGAKLAVSVDFNVSKEFDANVLTGQGTIFTDYFSRSSKLNRHTEQLMTVQTAKRVVITYMFG